MVSTLTRRSLSPLVNRLATEAGPKLVVLASSVLPTHDTESGRKSSWKVDACDAVIVTRRIDRPESACRACFRRRLCAIIASGGPAMPRIESALQLVCAAARSAGLGQRTDPELLASFLDGDAAAF